MTKRDENTDPGFRGTLPGDLQALDRELSGIRIEERPSFGPELEGELLREWREGPRGRGRAWPRWVRPLLAAGLAGLMIAGVSVPSARAAVSRLVRTVALEARTFLQPPPAEEPQLPAVPVRNPAVPVAESRTEMMVSPADASDPLEDTKPDLHSIPEVTITFPGIISRQEAERIIASYYPQVLKDAGIDGTVKLLFWVGPDGKAENIQVRSTSGSQALDYAAMLAARDIAFRPASRNGVAVGTWVEVDIHFFALSGDGVIGNDSLDHRP